MLTTLQNKRINKTSPKTPSPKTVQPPKRTGPKPIQPPKRATLKTVQPPKRTSPKPIRPPINAPPTFQDIQWNLPQTPISVNRHLAREITLKM